MSPRQPARRPEAGAATAELAVATPVLLLLLTSIVQFALWQHAVHVAEAAAQEGTRAARAEGGTAAAGEARARAFLAELAPTLILEPQVTATRDAATARVAVTGATDAIVLGIDLPVRAVSEAPVERFRPSTEAP